MSEDVVNRNGRIGPHEGIEHELLLSGEKHVAYFPEIFPTACEPISAMEAFALFEWTKLVNRVEVHSTILYRCTHKTQAERLRVLVEQSGWDADREREIGHILGYADADIELFVLKCEKRGVD